MKNIMPTLQWLLFIVSGSIVTPIAVAGIYNFNVDQTIDFIARTFFVLAITGLLQVWFGHHMPVLEGPAGLWWGIFALYANLGVVIYGSLENTLQTLEFALLISGGIAILLGLFGLIEKIAKFFTPAVTGTYMILLVAQLSGSFLNGLLGVDLTGKISYKIAILSFIIVLISFLTAHHYILRQFGIVISIVVGYILFSVFGLSTPFHEAKSFFKLPQLFAFGSPNVDWGIVPTVFFITLLLITNMLATVKVVQSVLKREGKKIPEMPGKKTGAIMGISQLLSGLFASVGSVPISGTAGFIATSKIISRTPFIIASLVIIVLTFFSPVIAVIATIPAAVGYAAIFPAFSGLLSIGIKELFSSEAVEKTISKVVVPLFVGLGVMFIPTEAYSSLPPLVASILSNGLVLGTIMILLVEVIDVKKQQFRKNQ
ncbi:purine/pyrimidine permease [Schinkia azotoformans]|uniref:purine/pyrimidine permease n=1 Tax=Schinkia azotoformans TaxID=1454 RepID=UPI002E1A6FC0|nr:purine/pyrimidine permease [Schinkia azotoformans]MED4351563.1 purine/pyrimidine permease [Schinkia azotoformans]